MQWTATHSDAVRVIFSVFIIAQIVTRNILYFISWLQKVSLKKLLFEFGTCSDPLVFIRTFTFWKKIVCLFYKSLLTFLTLVNCKGPYLSEGFLHNLCQCLNIVYAQLGVIPRTRNKFAEIVVVAERYLIITHVKVKNQRSSRSEYAFP